MWTFTTTPDTHTRHNSFGTRAITSFTLTLAGRYHKNARKNLRFTNCIQLSIHLLNINFTPMITTNRLNLHPSRDSNPNYKVENLVS